MVVSSSSEERIGSSSPRKKYDMLSASQRRKGSISDLYYKSLSEQHMRSLSRELIGLEGIPVIKSTALAATTALRAPLPLPPVGDLAKTEECNRHARKLKAQDFLCHYQLGHLECSKFYSFDKKTCIWRNGDCSWLDDSSGILWVGIHGKDSICVVTMAEDMQRGRISGGFYEDEEIVCDFRITVIPEIEDIADPSSKLHVMLAQSIETPFGIVSVKCGDESVDETVNGVYKADKYGERNAIKFIQEKMKTTDAFSSEETIQIAISAFQLLLNKKFNVDDIGVSVFNLKEIYSKELDRCDMKHHLDEINPCSEYSKELGDIKHHVDEINPCSENQSRRSKQRLGTMSVFGPVSRQALGSPRRSRRLGISKKGVVEYLKCEIEDLSRLLFVLGRGSRQALGSPRRIRRLLKRAVLELDKLKNVI